MTDGSPTEITFVVPGDALPATGVSRGGPAAAAPTSSMLGARGRVIQSVRVGAQRSGGSMVRLTARQGQDAVVLHVTNGPSLMLHPETARALMLAQSGATRSAVRGAGRGGVKGSADGLPAEVTVSAQLAWRGLEQAGAARGASRGRLGQVLLSAVEVVTGLSMQSAARLSALKLGEHVDGQVDAGVYRLNADSLAALRGSKTKVDRIVAAPDGAPVLVLMHGTFSETHGTFGKLWHQHPQRVRELFARYGGRVYALDHPTLTVSPIENALMLEKALPDGARVHLLTHSRGGLVGEVLARACAQPKLDPEALGVFDGEKHRPQLEALRRLAANLEGRGVQVERMVRVACPARGTLLASKRLDAYVSVLKWTLELAGIPVAPVILDFLGEVATQRADALVMPGLEAMMPESPLVQWLHAAERPLPGVLRVVAGDIEGDSIASWVKTLVADSFYWTDNDFVVQTRSMYGGSPRESSGGQAGASFVFDQGGKVTHFSYFGNERTAEAVCNALIHDAPPGFRPIGPLSWAGESSTGVRAARRRVDGKAAAERPAVFVLPGILGSHLKVAGKRVWLSWRIVGGLSRLAYPDAKVEPDGPIGASYDELIEFLSDSHEVVPFAYDWRRPIEEEARRLAAAMDAALTARDATGQPVRLVAHSMGGLVARTVQLERPDVWQRWLARPGARLLMLGTPNGGSWAPMQVLSGDDTFGNALAAFGAPFQEHKARQVMADMPGFLQLQAALLEPSLGLRDADTWKKLAADDLALVMEHSWWHSDAHQRDAYSWGLPSKKVLELATELRRKLDAQRDQAHAVFADRVTLVVGRAEFTPDGYEVLPNEGLVYLDAPDDGDGRVTRASALLPGVRTWAVDCPHGDLAAAEGAFNGYLDLLTLGETTRLAPLVAGARSRGTAAAAGAVASARSARVRRRPSRERGAANRPPEAMDSVFHAGTGGGPPESVRAAALRVTVTNGNLRFVSQPLIVGHYGAAALTGTEHVVDTFIGGAMNQSLAAGLYPEALGTHQVFVNTQRNSDNPLTMPRPEAVIVAGLGEEGKLRTSELTGTVKQAVIAWAQRKAETPGGGPSHFELAATLMGSGGSGFTVGASALAVVQGVREANERLDDLAAKGWPQVSRLHLIELYLDRATEAWRSLQVLATSLPEHYVVTPEVLSGPGALRRPLDSGYRGAEYDFISAVSGKAENNEPNIVYTLDSRRARDEVRSQATQVRLVRKLVAAASNEQNTDPNIGRTLFQLLVPVEMEPYLGGAGEMVLELDDGTAVIPWELLDTPRDGRSGDVAPWAIRSKLLRKLRTREFRSRITDARVDDDVLIIGEPKCDPAVYPPLEGARKEAEAVREVMSGPLGLDASRVHALIAPDEGLGPTASEVIGALLARRYRIVHIAGHGDPVEEIPDKPPLTKGVVLSDKTFLGPYEVEAMRVVPELVFLNCCHLAAGGGSLLAGHDRASFAASVAKQLIRVGVRCVVAAGWAVEDAAARSFATVFYGALLSGQNFMNAVAAARSAAREASPGGNTWAAYQCYGDPSWEWRRSAGDPQHPPAPVGEEFAGIASPQALTLALETLAVRSQYHGDKPPIQREKLRHLEARFEVTWGGMGSVAEAFGRAYVAAEDTERAVRWYERALAANDGKVTVNASEQLANLRVRQAWRRVDEVRRARDAVAGSVAKAPGKGGSRNAARVGSKELRQAQGELETAIDQGRAEIAAAIVTLEALIGLAPTMARETLRGSAQKRLAMLEGVAGHASAEANAIKSMAAHYRTAEDLARTTRDARIFYPALNRMAGDLIANRGRAEWSGFDAGTVAQVRQALERATRDDPDFWSIAGLTELRMMQALAARQLAKELPSILSEYEDLHQRVADAWMWSSVRDQASFVLTRLERGAESAEATAAKKLLEVLEGHAGADPREQGDPPGPSPATRQRSPRARVRRARGGGRSPRRR